MENFRYKHLLHALSALTVVGAIAVCYATEISDSEILFNLSYGRYLIEHHTLIPDHSRARGINPSKAVVSVVREPVLACHRPGVPVGRPATLMF